MQKQVEKNYGLGLGLATIIALSILGGLSAPTPPGGNQANSGGLPANKFGAAGSTAIVLDPQEKFPLLTTTIKTSNPQDLLFQVTLECVITTELTTLGNDVQNATGRVRVWVEDNGVVVPVSSDDDEDRGKVTFCNHIEERETTNFDDEDATIRTLHEIGASNAFNWIKLDVGHGIHEIVVYGELTTSSTAESDAIAAVGKRTLAIEPVHAAQGATI